MGLLDSVLGGLAGARGGQNQGGMSKMSMLLMALLAYRSYQGRGGMQGGGLQGGGLAGNTSGGLGGGLGDLLRGGLGGGGGGLGGGGLGGLLGGLLAGGGAGGLLSGGLSDLVRQFQQNGQGSIADSWVGRGANEAISPEELERGLGEDNVRALAEQAGIPRNELLSGLSQDLPHFVDSLTPEGRIPSEDEAGKWV
jgi:uncharacterized protein YidB (DUF937 family)